MPLIIPESLNDRFSIPEITGPFQTTLIAEEELTDGRPVKVGTKDFFTKLSTLASELSIGVTHISPDGTVAVDNEINVSLFGPVKRMTADGTITRGDQVKASGSGTVKTTAVTGDFVVGIALNSRADTEKVSIVLIPATVK